MNKLNLFLLFLFLLIPREGYARDFWNCTHATITTSPIHQNPQNVYAVGTVNAHLHCTGDVTGLQVRWRYLRVGEQTPVVEMGGIDHPISNPVPGPVWIEEILFRKISETCPPDDCPFRGFTPGYLVLFDQAPTVQLNLPGDCLVKKLVSLSVTTNPPSSVPAPPSVNVLGDSYHGGQQFNYLPVARQTEITAQSRSAYGIQGGSDTKTLTCRNVPIGGVAPPKTISLPYQAFVLNSFITDPLNTEITVEWELISAPPGMGMTGYKEIGDGNSVTIGEFAVPAQEDIVAGEYIFKATGTNVDGETASSTTKVTLLPYEVPTDFQVRLTQIRDDFDFDGDGKKDLANKRSAVLRISSPNVFFNKPLEITATVAGQSFSQINNSMNGRREYLTKISSPTMQFTPGANWVDNEIQITIKYTESGQIKTHNRSIPVRWWRDQPFSVAFVGLKFPASACLPNQNCNGELQNLGDHAEGVWNAVNDQFPLAPGESFTVAEKPFLASPTLSTSENFHLEAMDRELIHGTIVGIIDHHTKTGRCPSKVSIGATRDYFEKLRSGVGQFLGVSDSNLPVVSIVEEKIWNAGVHEFLHSGMGNTRLLSDHEPASVKYSGYRIRDAHYFDEWHSLFKSVPKEDSVIQSERVANTSTLNGRWNSHLLLKEYFEYLKKPRAAMVDTKTTYLGLLVDRVESKISLSVATSFGANCPVTYNEEIFSEANLEIANRKNEVIHQQQIPVSGSLIPFAGDHAGSAGASIVGVPFNYESQFVSVADESRRISGRFSVPISLLRSSIQRLPDSAFVADASNARLELADELNDMEQLHLSGGKTDLTARIRNFKDAFLPSRVKPQFEGGGAQDTSSSELANVLNDSFATLVVNESGLSSNPLVEVREVRTTDNGHSMIHLEIVSKSGLTNPNLRFFMAASLNSVPVSVMKVGDGWSTQRRPATHGAHVWVVNVYAESYREQENWTVAERASRDLVSQLQERLEYEEDPVERSMILKLITAENTKIASYVYLKRQGRIALGLPTVLVLNE